MGRKKKSSVKKRRVEKRPVEKTGKEKIKEYVEKNRDVIRFGLLFVSLLLFFHILFWKYVVKMAFPVDFTGRTMVFLLGLLGVESSISGSSVILPGIPLDIIYECTGIYSFFVYLSLIIAYPTDLRKKAIGTAFGIPAIFTVNQIRLVFMALTGIYYPRIFDFVHIYLWQVSVIVFVVIFWLIWFDKVVKEDEG